MPYDSIFVAVAIVRAGAVTALHDTDPVVFVHIDAAEIFFVIFIIFEIGAGTAGTLLKITVFLSDHEDFSFPAGYGISIDRIRIFQFRIVQIQ